MSRALSLEGGPPGALARSPNTSSQMWGDLWEMRRRELWEDLSCSQAFLCSQV